MRGGGRGGPIVRCRAQGGGRALPGVPVTLRPGEGVGRVVPIAPREGSAAPGGRNPERRGEGGGDTRTGMNEGRGRRERREGRRTAAQSRGSPRSARPAPTPIPAPTASALARPPRTPPGRTHTRAAQRGAAAGTATAAVEGPAWPAWGGWGGWGRCPSVPTAAERTDTSGEVANKSEQPPLCQSPKCRPRPAPPGPGPPPGGRKAPVLGGRSGAGSVPAVPAASAAPPSRDALCAVPGAPPSGRWGRAVPSRPAVTQRCRPDTPAPPGPLPPRLIPARCGGALGAVFWAWFCFVEYFPPNPRLFFSEITPSSPPLTTEVEKMPRGTPRCPRGHEDSAVGGRDAAGGTARVPDWSDGTEPRASSSRRWHRPHPCVPAAEQSGMRQRGCREPPPLVLGDIWAVPHPSRPQPFLQRRGCGGGRDPRP